MKSDLPMKCRPYVNIFVYVAVKLEMLIMTLTDFKTDYECRYDQPVCRIGNYLGL